MLAVKEKIKQSFEGLYDLIQWELIQTPNRKKLLKIQVNRAHKPAFVLASGKEYFFVRTTPATESLEGSKMIGYIARRFSSDKL